ncbi:MAG TPA: ABC transporter ATP-binding protein [Planctomycetota bacterium]|nr:ABC transporter ATP-binding protein [Planctomycetota bacterium]
MSDPGQRRALLSARDIRKAFAIGERTLEVLHGVHMDLYAGEVLALMGPSGAGKSTLLHVLGLLDEPSEGEVLLDGTSAWKLPGEERARLRNSHLGFVFQFYHLLSELTALENVLLQPMIAQGRGAFRRQRAAHTAKARDLLDRFGLTARMDHRPSQLSGGERQRVALARALFGDPKIVIADEPTGNLDSGTGEKVLELLFGEQVERGYALLLVTHDERLAARCHRQLYMDDGQIQLDSGVPIPQ